MVSCDIPDILHVLWFFRLFFLLDSWQFTCHWIFLLWFSCRIPDILHVMCDFPVPVFLMYSLNFRSPGIFLGQLCCWFPGILLVLGFYRFVCSFPDLFLSWGFPDMYLDVPVLVFLLYSWHFTCHGIFVFYLSCYISDTLHVMGYSCFFPAVFLTFYMSCGIPVLFFLMYSWNFTSPGIFLGLLSCCFPGILLVLSFYRFICLLFSWPILVLRFSWHVLGCSGSSFPAVILTFYMSWYFPVLISCCIHL